MRLVAGGYEATFFREGHAGGSPGKGHGGPWKRPPSPKPVGGGGDLLLQPHAHFQMVIPASSNKNASLGVHPHCLGTIPLPVLLCHLLILGWATLVRPLVFTLPPSGLQPGCPGRSPLASSFIAPRPLAPCQTQAGQTTGQWRARWP